MEKALRLALCVITGLLLLGELRLTGATESGNTVSKGGDSEGQEGTDPQTLTVTMILQDPYAMARGTELEGYCLDLLDALAKMLHFKYKVTMVKDGRYGSLSSSGNWTGMVGEIIRQEADLAVAPLTITSTREEVVSFTMPFLATGIGILLRKDAASQGSSLFCFLTPFSKETWTGLIVAYLLTCLCLFLAARLSPCEWKEPKSEENRFTFLNSLWFGAGALALQGAAPHPKALSGRIIAAVWWVFTITLLAAYVASFAALLRTGNEPLSIRTFEDLVKQRELEFGTLESSSTFQFFKNSRNPVHQMIYEYMDKRRDYVLVKSYHEAVQRVLESNYAFIGESITQDLAVARHCNLIRAPEVVGARGFGIAAAKGSPWASKLSTAILKLGESGILDYLHHKWWETSCFHKGQDAWSPLKPQAMGGLFLVLAVGLTLGVIVALVELANKSRHAAEQEKKSCCSVILEEMSHRFRIREGARENPEKVKP
ncbi:probable glutamate receptor [Emydura macquarii macquarii]|uniref:probable glutamate receptor n=1 Tax=Emydura macquarii macquarii TaxID=1129001 RepID=UPI00352AF95A